METKEITVTDIVKEIERLKKFAEKKMENVNYSGQERILAVGRIEGLEMILDFIIK